MKKLCCILISLLLLGSVSIPVFAMEIDNTYVAHPQAAIVKAGSSTKRYYFDLDSYPQVPVDVTMHWSLTYFVNTGEVSTCSTPSVSVSIPSSYQFSDMFNPTLLSVTTNKQKSGNYACLFTATYDVVIPIAGGWVTVSKTDSFRVKAEGDGEVSIQ